MDKRADGRRCQGAAALEAALVLPLVLLVLLGGIEYALVFHVTHTMTLAAREGARQVAVRGGTAAQARTVVADRLSGLHANFTTTVTTPSSPSSPNQDVVVTISVPRSAFAMGMLDFSANSQIQVRVTMRKEPD